MARMKEVGTGAYLPRQIRTGLLFIALTACGRTGAGPGGPDSGATGDAPTSASGGATGQAGSDGPPSTGGAGGTGGGGGASPTGPPVDIAGRWGLFLFEDAVGLRLIQAADGTLTGEGCAAGAPGATNLEPLLGAACGPAFGRVVGQTASFGFSPTEPGAFTYRLDVTVSTDGRRMAGFITTMGEKYKYTIALQRVRDDALWLEGGALTKKSAVDGGYELTLIPTASSETEFVAGTAYHLFYREQKIFGHLGAFWIDEISAFSEGSPLRVGPVSGTIPNLATTVVLDFEGAAFSTVTATTASGGRYQFAARKTGP